MKDRTANHKDVFKPQGALKIFLTETCEQCKAPIYTNQSLVLLEPNSESDQEKVVHSDCIDDKCQSLVTKLEKQHRYVIESMEESELSEILQKLSRGALIKAIRAGDTRPVLLAKYSCSQSKIERIKSLCSEIDSFKLRNCVIDKVLHSVLTLWPRAKSPNPQSGNQEDLAPSEEQVVEMLKDLVVILFNKEPKYKVYPYLESFLDSWSGLFKDGASTEHLLIVLEAILNFPLPAWRCESIIIKKAISACLSTSYDVETTLVVVKQLREKGFVFDEEKHMNNQSILHWMLDEYTKSKKWDEVLELADALVGLGAKTNIKDNSNNLPIEKVIILGWYGKLSIDEFEEAFAIFTEDLGEDKILNDNVFTLYQLIFSVLTNPKEGDPNFPFIKKAAELLLKSFKVPPFKKISTLFKKRSKNLECFETPLHLICRKNALTRDQAFEIVTLILDRFPTLRDIPGEGGYTPLHLFCQFWGANAGKEDVDINPLLDQLRFFMKDGKVNQLDENNLSPLQTLVFHWIKNGATPRAITRALAVLVEGGHDINASEESVHVAWILIKFWFEEGISPVGILHALCHILGLGAKFCHIDTESGDTLLHYVVKKWLRDGEKYEEKYEDVSRVIDFLLNSGVSVLEQNNYSKTIVHLICERWVGYGIKVEQIQTTLKAIFAKAASLEYLLSLTDKNKFTAVLSVGSNWLSQGASVKEVIQGLQFLVSQGASAEVVDANNNNLLSHFVTDLQNPEKYAGQELSYLEDLLKLAPGLTINTDNRLSTPNDQIEVETDEPSELRTYLNSLWKKFPALAFRREVYASTPLHIIFSRALAISMRTRCQLTKCIIEHEASLPNSVDKDVPFEGIIYKLRLKNENGDTPVLAAARWCLEAADFDFDEFSALLKVYFANGAEVNESDTNGNTIVTLFFKQDLSRFSQSEIWNFVWFMNELNYNFETPKLKDYRADIQRAFIGAQLEGSVANFEKAWRFVYDLTKENLLEVEYKGVTMWHIGARQLSVYQFNSFFKECSDEIIAKVFESSVPLLDQIDAAKASRICHRVAFLLPYSKNNHSEVARQRYAESKFLILENKGKLLDSLSQAAVYQCEENFKEAVVECCSYLQSCDDNYQAQLQGVDALLVMKNAVCEQQIQPARIVVTLNRLIRKELFNRSLIAKMLEEFGLRWLYCYEYKERWLFFSNGGSHRFSLIRAEIYLLLVCENSQYFETLKNQFKQPTQENKEWLDSVKEVLEVISDPNNKDFPHFLRGSETLMGRVTQLQQLKNSEHNINTTHSIPGRNESGLPLEGFDSKNI